MLKIPLFNKKKTNEELKVIRFVLAEFGYKPQKAAYFIQALTHKSSLTDHEQLAANERLEFLGDSILDAVVASFVYEKYPEIDEGQLTKIKSRIVNRKSLSAIGERMGIRKYLIYSQGRSINLAGLEGNAFEALIGAIYLDGGFDAARIFILRQMEEVFTEIANQPEEINPKGFLQEILQAIEPAAPEYQILSQSGPEHSKNFICSVVWNGQELGRGCGSSKKEAQVAAAQVALSERQWEKSDKVPAPLLNLQN